MNVDDVVDGNIDLLSPQLRDLSSFQETKLGLMTGMIQRETIAA